MATHNIYRCSTLSRLATLALFCTMTMCCCAQHLKSRSHHVSSQSDCGGDDHLVCLIYKRVATYQLMEEQGFEVTESYDCRLGDDDMTFDLPLSKEFVDSHPDLDLGLTSVLIPGGCIKGSTVTYSPNANITVLPPEQRRLDERRKEGTISLLVVRATEKGYPELRSNDKIREMIFDNVAGSLARQMSDCSFGKFNIEKAKGPGINDGLLEVDLDIDVAGMWNRDIETDYLVPLLAPYGGEDAFDHVYYCIPYGSYAGRNRTGSRTWLAYALVNHGRSVYNHFWCGLLTGSMHEVGHNLGLHHSGQSGWKYGDGTGVMGWSTYEEYSPRSCFNARKFSHLGWYNDRSIDLSVYIHEDSWGGRLVAFVDYNVTSQGDVVLIKVGNLYAQYNRARDFNAGTREYANRVVIVSSSQSSLSNLEAALANNIAVSTFTYPNFDDTPYDLIFKVCDQVQGPVDYVQLSIHLNDGVQSSACN